MSGTPPGDGAHALTAALRAAGVSVCFTNPGTSEIHLVAALQDTPGTRTVMCLFEGVATGAADGYGRMAPLPAMTLLHQGAGLANGLANLHNAQRAGTPVLNVVGDGAITHHGLGAPLESDVAALARPMSQWVRSSAHAADLGADALAALRAACGPPSGVATLVVPSDVAWSPCRPEPPDDAARPPSPTAADPAAHSDRQAHATASAGTPTASARALRAGPGTLLLLGGRTLTARGLAAADRIARATGARILAEPFPGRLERGLGVPFVERLSAAPEAARARLADVTRLILAGAARPVTAFATPGVPGDLVPPGCAVTRLAGHGQDVVEVLEEVADQVAPGIRPRRHEALPGPRPSAGAELTAETVARVVGAVLPEGAVLVDETNTSGAALPAATAASARHDLLTLSGFAIGQGLPLAVGAQLACPGRPVICLEADGSAMYTLSALWTQARENLDVTVLVLNNRSYAILRREARRMLGPSAEPLAGLFDLDRPDLDFVRLSEGMGVPACRVRTVGELADRLKGALSEPGPHLIDVPVPAAH
ncbi:acetolactate synthase large subunit [Streptomyces sp. AN091965]|uniref:acetolactate synthase large subunit n=1 Tax=Streptomyces sp. AN091965 TaxID=2927803 RepID=UPI001F6227E5|nr:acetolactate synthase large subunit [Streptomyces sp. AN091965]MCI3935540.1 acetolactate synthase large subunit [Streptomyces sp. AN091965]